MKVYIICLFIVLQSLHASAQKFIPEVQLGFGHSVIVSKNTAQNGIFDKNYGNISNSIGISNNFNIQNHYFFRAGFRMNNYGLTVGAQSQSPSTLAKPYPIIWKQTLTSFNISLSIGKEFLMINNSPAQFYIGLAPGMFAIPFSSITVQSPQSKFLLNTDSMTFDTEFAKLTTTAFLPLLDLGFRINPFKKNSKISFGFVVSAQVFNTSNIQFNAIQKDLFTNNSYKYLLKLNQRSIDANVIFGYSFNKTKKMKFNLNPLGN